MSKKLTGNGRWESSRMMLPQHKEALNERQDPKPVMTRSAVPSKEELEMIRDHILLPIMLTMVEKNGKDLQLSPSTLQKLYIAVAQMMLNHIHSDLSKVNKALRASQIKVFQDDHEDDGLHYRFICRGYEDKFAMMREVVKANISVKMSEYIRRLIAEMNTNRLNDEKLSK